MDLGAEPPRMNLCWVPLGLRGAGAEVMSNRTAAVSSLFVSSSQVEIPFITVFWQAATAIVSTAIIKKYGENRVALPHAPYTDTNNLLWDVDHIIEKKKKKKLAWYCYTTMLLHTKLQNHLPIMN